MSCEKTDDGCNGGLQEDAFKYIIKTGGLVTEKAYPCECTSLTRARP